MVWASDERLLVRIALGGRTVTERTSARSLGSSTAEAVISRRMVSIDPDTGGGVVLFDNEPQRMRTMRNLGSVVDLLHDDTHPTEGAYRVTRDPIRFDSRGVDQGLPRRHAPRLGQHTAEVLAEVGWADGQIAGLLAD